MANEKSEPKPLPKTIIVFRDPHDNPSVDKLYIAHSPDEVLNYTFRKDGISAAIYDLTKKILITRETKVTEQENGRSRKAN